MSREYQVFFKIIGRTPNLNRCAFTFTLADDPEIAVHKVRSAHGHQTLEIIGEPKLIIRDSGGKVELTER